MTAEEVGALVTEYYRPNQFTVGELKLITEFVHKISKDELEAIFKELIKAGTRPDVSVIKLKVNQLRFSGSTPRHVDSDAEIQCTACLDTGYNYVLKKDTGDLKGFVRCECSVGFAHGSEWVPQWSDEYSADLRMVPMSARPSLWNPGSKTSEIENMAEAWKTMVRKSDAFWESYFKAHVKPLGGE